MPRFSDLTRRAGHQRWFARIGRAYAPLDRWLGQITKGRFVALGLRTLPSLLITTTGRRSGQPRTNPLLYAPDADAFIVVGSNWGQPHHPAWSTNLLAHPDATVTLDGRTVAVRATLATGAERDRLWALVRRTWPAYQTYQDRAGARQIRIFRLDPC